MFLGQYSFLSASPSCIAPAMTNVEHITKIELMNSLFGDLYGTKKLYIGDDGNVTHPNTLPDDWDFDTIIYAKFNDNTKAGNVDWSAKELTGIVIVRKESGDFNWIHVDYHEVTGNSTINFKGTDITPGEGKYQYAIAPLLNEIEGDYIITEVDTNVENIVVVDTDGVWYTMLTDGSYTINYNMPSTPVETMFSKYPTIVRNTTACYRTLDLSGQWLPFDDLCIEVDIFDHYTIGKYEEEFWNWLHDGHTKLVKTPDGKLFLGYVTTPASISVEANTGCSIKETSFGVTEVGDHKREIDLYNAGLLHDVPYKYIKDN